MRSLILNILTEPAFLVAWGILLAASLVVLILDLATPCRRRLQGESPRSIETRTRPKEMPHSLG